MEGKDFCCYEFGGFRLDARRRSLSKNGEKVSLPARNFDLLLFMVENSGRVLEHDELLDKVWAGTFVEQATLKKGISALRQILAEKPENEFIKTIPRRGYSFVSPVRFVPEHQEVFFVRKTEQEIIVEEYEEIDDNRDQPAESAKPIEISADSVNRLPAAEIKKRKFSRLAAIGFAGIAAVALTFFIFQSYFSKTVQSQFSAENVRITRVTNSGKIAGGTTISPDGSYLVYPTTEKDGAVLWVRQLLANSTTKLTAPIKGNFWGFAVAPDNSYVYYIFNNQAEPQKSGLYKIPLMGGKPPQRIKENVSSLTISPDGKRIALVRLSDKINIFTVNPDGEDERTVAAFTGDIRLWGISWTPDSTALLGTFRKTVDDKPRYYVSEISLEGGQETIVMPLQEKIIFGAVWLPDKSAMLLTMRESNADIRQIWQYFPDSKDWRRVTNDNNSYKFANLTQDGKTIITSQESRLAAIWIIDGLVVDKKTPEKKSLLNNSDNFRQITDGVSNFDRVGWLNDDRLIYSTTEDGREVLSTINSDGTNPRQITKGEDGIWLFPSVAGNGQSIGFLSSQTGLKQVWRIDADGKNLTKMTQTSSPVLTARILRDNSTVVYTIQQGSDVLLFKQSPEGETVRLTEADTGSFAVSADGDLLAVEILDKNTGKYQVELRSMADGKTLKIFNFLPKREMAFTPDGKNLVYDAPQGDICQIMIQPLEGGEPFPITDFQTEDIFSFDWSRDGGHFAVIRGKQLNDAVVIKNGIR